PASRISGAYCGGTGASARSWPPVTPPGGTSAELTLPPPAATAIMKAATRSSTAGTATGAVSARIAVRRLTAPALPSPPARPLRVGQKLRHQPLPAGARGDQRHPAGQHTRGGRG